MKAKESRSISYIPAKYQFLFFVTRAVNNSIKIVFSFCRDFYLKNQLNFIPNVNAIIQKDSEFMDGDHPTSHNIFIVRPEFKNSGCQ